MGDNTFVDFVDNAYGKEHEGEFYWGYTLIKCFINNKGGQQYYVIRPFGKTVDSKTNVLLQEDEYRQSDYYYNESLLKNSDSTLSFCDCKSEKTDNSGYDFFEDFSKAIEDYCDNMDEESYHDEDDWMFKDENDEYDEYDEISNSYLDNDFYEKENMMMIYKEELEKVEIETFDEEMKEAINDYYKELAEEDEKINNTKIYMYQDEEDDNFALNYEEVRFSEFQGKIGNYKNKYYYYTNEQNPCIKDIEEFLEDNSLCNNENISLGEVDFYNDGLPF